MLGAGFYYNGNLFREQGVAPPTNDWTLDDLVAAIAPGRLPYGLGPAAGGWSAVKVLWVAGPEYQGPALIRGRQPDGPHDVRFGAGAAPPLALRFPAGGTGVNSPTWVASGWRDLPSTTRLRAPGCYAWQVDGLDFSTVLVFAARFTTDPAEYPPPAPAPAP